MNKLSTNKRLLTVGVILLVALVAGMAILLPNVNIYKIENSSIKDSFADSQTDPGFKQVSMAMSHSIALDDEGKLYAWGYNYQGQLGLGDNVIEMERNYSPTRVSGEAFNRRFTTVGTGNRSSYAIDTEGHLWAWGYNGCGELGVGDTTNRYLPVRVGGIAQSKTFKSIAKSVAGQGGDVRSHILAITTEGELYAWGDERYGANGTNGANPLLPAKVLGALENKKVKKATCGDNSSFAITEDDQLYSWGRNDYGQLGYGYRNSVAGVNNELPNRVSEAAMSLTFKDVAAGGDHVLALTADGSLYSWGYNSYCDLGRGYTSDPYAQTMNDPFPLPVSGPALTMKFKTIGAGKNSSFAINYAGEIYAFGWNGYQGLGLGTENFYDVPVPTKATNSDTLPEFKMVDGGEGVGIAISADNKIYVWGGYNFYGELGVGITSSDGGPEIDGRPRNYTPFFLADRVHHYITNVTPYTDEEEQEALGTSSIEPTSLTHIIVTFDKDMVTDEAIGAEVLTEVDSDENLLARRNEETGTSLRSQSSSAGKEWLDSKTLKLNLADGVLKDGKNYTLNLNGHKMDSLFDFTLAPQSFSFQTEGEDNGNSDGTGTGNGNGGTNIKEDSANSGNIASFDKKANTNDGKSTGNLENSSVQTGDANMDNLWLTLICGLVSLIFVTIYLLRTKKVSIRN